MAIDDVKEQGTTYVEPAGSGHGAKFLVIFLILAALAVGEFYAVSKISSLREETAAQQKQFRKELDAQLQEQVIARLTALEQQQTQQLAAIRGDLEKSSKNLGTQSRAIRKADAMFKTLQDQQRQQGEDLKQEIAQKADQGQVGALTQDVSATKLDLDTTKKAVATVQSDLGMARSELGTLIARNHDDIENLRKLGDRDYFEFTLSKSQPSKVAGVGLALRRTSVKRHRYTLDMTVDDVQVEKKDRTINEPVFFYTNGSKKAYEMVVNSVENGQVKGYISTPKGASPQVAARSGGAR